MALLQLSQAAGGAVRQHLPAVRGINLNAETPAHMRSITLAGTQVSARRAEGPPNRPPPPWTEIPPKTNTRWRNTAEQDVNDPESGSNVKRKKETKDGREKRDHHLQSADRAGLLWRGHWTNGCVFQVYPGRSPARQCVCLSVCVSCGSTYLPLEGVSELLRGLGH